MRGIGIREDAGESHQNVATDRYGDGAAIRMRTGEAIAPELQPFDVEPIAKHVVRDEAPVSGAPALRVQRRNRRDVVSGGRAQGVVRRQADRVFD